MSVVDLGCGSGRTAIQIARRLPTCTYVGIDVVQDLLDHAKSICPPGYRFIRSTEVSFPLPDASADLIIGFSVFTHLLHEECYAYLQDAARVLRPGGKFVFSFFEFARADQWTIFAETVESRKADTFGHMNTFVERNAIEAWSRPACRHDGRGLLRQGAAIAVRAAEGIAALSRKRRIGERSSVPLTAVT